jgi:hypothetical protein
MHPALWGEGNYAAMTRFLTVSAQQDGKPHTINAARIVMLYPIEGGTMIKLDSSAGLSVREEYPDIVRRVIHADGMAGI